MPSECEYVTNSLTVSSGWTKEFSTNNSPVQTYNSSDYSIFEQAANRIKWLRCKKNLVYSNTGLFMTYKVLVK